MFNRQKWMPRIIEGTVIIASILLAFLIDAWWQERQKALMERQIILAVISEIESNTSMANDAIASHKTALENIKKFLVSDVNQFVELSPEEIYKKIEYFPYSMEYVANLSAANMLIQSPPLNENGIVVRRSVGEYMRASREQAGIVIDQERRNILRLMSGVISEREDFDFTNSDFLYIQSLVAHVGPNTLAQLRSNPEFVKHLLDKSHIQIILLSRLEQLVIKMEKLKLELSELTD
ncbi:hypothetical protein [Aliiglaciecola lipolytica]|uniref:Uncharacterized protein n=1 Tax=Aliiglaciecola lipolytica E3 TaxID=1127673 RepID=K6YQ84_9ALTE|nr:hypothetical protein [Aliiglaciecola lipolytica]GAC13495.1 hypothetical protein GLIP_0850 [Aliiglaciecola lipolytica E3]